VFHGIYTISPKIIIYESHKIVVTSNRCRLSRSLNINVNIIQNPLGAVSHCAEFHLDLLSYDAMFTKLQFAGSSTFLQTLLCKSLQRLFTCMSEPHIPQYGRIIIWICRSRHMTYNCTTFQVVEIISADALQNHYWALVILRTPSLIDTSKPNVSKSPTKIRFLLCWGTCLTSFNSHTIPSNILIWIVLIPSILHERSSPMITEHPSSFSKIETNPCLGIHDR